MGIHSVLTEGHCPGSGERVSEPSQHSCAPLPRSNGRTRTRTAPPRSKSSEPPHPNSTLRLRAAASCACSVRPRATPIPHGPARHVLPNSCPCGHRARHSSRFTSRGPFAFLRWLSRPAVFASETDPIRRSRQVSDLQDLSHTMCKPTITTSMGLAPRRPANRVSQVPCSLNGQFIITSWLRSAERRRPADWIAFTRTSWNRACGA